MAWRRLINGDLDGAARLLAEAWPAIRATGDLRLLSVALQTTGALALARGDVQGAEADFAACLDTSDTLAGQPAAIEGLALVAARTGRHERALRLAAAAAATRAAASDPAGPMSPGPMHSGPMNSTDPTDPWWLARVDDMRAAAERELPAPRAAAAVRAGGLLTPAQAVTYARWDVWTERTRMERAAALPLSARERQVADMVAGGLTNRQVAARLGLSVRTVDAHVRSIRARLGVRSRTQIAGWVARHPVLVSGYANS